MREEGSGVDTATDPAARTGTHLLYPQLDRRYSAAVRAEGSYVYDADGRRYLDGCSGAIVTNLGHGNTEILDAVRAQLDRITFVTRLAFTNPWAERLAAELTGAAPGDLDFAFFTNSGSEGTEAAIRLALQYWQEVGRPDKTVMVSRDGSYHGATIGAVALSGHPERRRPVASVLPDWPKAAAANCAACPFGLTRESCALECARSIEVAIRRAGADRVAAVVVEPVVGASGGAVPAPDGYLEAVAEICRRHDVLLIADEVISGLGRCGTWFGVDAAGVVPDLLVLGKGLSAGYTPLGAVLLTRTVHEAIRSGTGRFPLGHTYAANPLSAAVGLAVLRYTREHDLPGRAARLGPYLAAGLRRVLDGCGVVGADVRGRGLLQAVDFSAPCRPSGITAVDLVAAAADAGLMLYPAGVTTPPRAVVVAPPLTVTREELDDLLARFAAALGGVPAMSSDRPATRPATTDRPTGQPTTRTGVR